MKYIEFCAGGGGMRAGLDAAGWQCKLAVDSDPDAVAVHRLAHGEAFEGDIAALSSVDLPEVDAWVAGFPCQPFSSSGNRLGFGHQAGNVFEHLVRLLVDRQPSMLLLENVQGLLTNKSGHTMSMILSKLGEVGYEVSWFLVDLRWFGVPQSRPRLFFIAANSKAASFGRQQDSHELLPGFGGGIVNSFDPMLRRFDVQAFGQTQGQLAAVEERLRPGIGRARPVGKRVFGVLGQAAGGRYSSSSARLPPTADSSTALGDIVAPHFRHRRSVRSGRYYARGGPTRLCLRTDPVSHCVGTSLGGAPLYAVSLALVSRPADRAAFLEFANWHREQDDVLVMRLRPDRAVLLFGPHTDALRKAVIEWDAGDTRKYKVVGNMVAPVCAKAVAGLIDEQLGTAD